MAFRGKEKQKRKQEMQFCEGEKFTHAQRQENENHIKLLLRRLTAC